MNGLKYYSIAAIITLCVFDMAWAGPETQSESIGRAGGTLVSSDGGSALLFNPGGIVRRSDNRFTLGIVLHDNDFVFRPDAIFPDPGNADRAVVDAVDRAPVASTFNGSFLLGSDSFVFGAAFLELGNLNRSFGKPTYNLLADAITELYPHRYMGTDFQYRHQMTLIGGAIRVNQWLGIGASLSTSKIETSEARNIWAFKNAHSQIGSPYYDLHLRAQGEDSFIPGGAIGIFMAPLEPPIEISFSCSYRSGATLRGSASLEDTRDISYPRVTGETSEATIPIASVFTLRGGIRYLGESIAAEIGFEHAIQENSDAISEWRFPDLEVNLSNGMLYPIANVASILQEKDRTSVRASMDLEVIEGFLWLTGGLALAGEHYAIRDQSMALNSNLQHTVATGLLAEWGNFSISFGYARTLTTATIQEDSRLGIINVAQPVNEKRRIVGNGHYETSVDRFGLSVTTLWE